MNGMNKPTTYFLQQHGRQLWGRELGKKARQQIEDLLERVSQGQFLVIELAGVEVMDFSFASEVFGKLIGQLSTSYPDRGILLANPDEYVSTNLDAALNALNMIGLTTTGQESWKLIGKALVPDIETMKAVHRHKQLTANDLANELDLKPTTAIQRLKKLADFGVIVSLKEAGTAGREQSVYRWLV